MAGPNPPHHPAGAMGQPFDRQNYPEPYPEDGFGRRAAPASYPPVYPGMLPPPVPYGRSKRRRTLWLSLLVLMLVGALVAAVVTIRADRPNATGAFTTGATQTTIQNYLTALSKGDTDVIARNSLCGLYDGIKDRRSDQALARLSSDAFRRQFSSAEVTSIDMIVLSSSYQAQVLFTMKVTPASGIRSARSQEQGVAQLLRQNNDLLVCSYLLRTAAQY